MGIYTVYSDEKELAGVPMAERLKALNPELITFIEEQKIFFVGTADSDGRVNISPKGQNSLAVMNPNEILWLNLTGSGNETAAHLLGRNRMTLMWCAFEGPPLILRVYGTADVIYPEDEQWKVCQERLEAPVGARQYFRLSINLVQTSCGYAVPEYSFQQNRQALTRWSEKRGADAIREYWQTTNSISLDGRPTRTT